MATAVMLGGCLGGRGSLDGKVIDIGNAGVPVTGAILVLTRSRPVGWATSATSCEGQQLTYSDGQGRFHFDSWSPPTHSGWDLIFPSRYLMNLTVYKHGIPGTEIGINDRYRGVVELNGGKTTPQALLMEIRTVALNIDCNYRYSEAMKPMIDALKAEAAELATTPKELEDAVGIFTVTAYSRQEREPTQTAIHPPPPPIQSGAAPSH